MKILLSILATLALALAPHTTCLAAPAGVVYTANFDGGVGPEWSTNRLTTAPSGSRTFLGEFTEEAVEVVITNLPAGHTNLTISLKLLALRDWVGGARLWRLRADGTQVYRGAFSSVGRGEYQNFPQSYASAWYPPRSGASETNTLGYTNACANCGDATYECYSPSPINRPQWCSTKPSSNGRRRILASTSNRPRRDSAHG